VRSGFRISGLYFWGFRASRSSQRQQRVIFGARAALNAKRSHRRSVASFEAGDDGRFDDVRQCARSRPAVRVRSVHGTGVDKRGKSDVRLGFDS